MHKTPTSLLVSVLLVSTPATVEAEDMEWWDHESEVEFEMPASFMQTRQHDSSEYDNMECSCEVMRCDCLKPCDCGEAYLDFEVIRIDGGCWCSKLECECQKRCDCVPTDTLPPKPPPPSPPSPPPPLSPSPPPPPPRPPFDPCACANNRAGTGSGRGEGGGDGWPAIEPNAVTDRPGCSAHVGDGIFYCYVVEPSTCEHGEMFSSVKYSGAKWLPCDVSLNYPWPVTQTEAFRRAGEEEARQAALPRAAASK